MKIGEITGNRELLNFGALPAPSNEPSVMYADVTRLTNEVGWRPVHTLDSGLRQTVEWWRDALKRQ